MLGSSAHDTSAPCLFIRADISQTSKNVPYDDWNKLGEDEDEELQDASVRAPLQFAL